MGLPSRVHIVELSARDGLKGLKRCIPVDFRVELLNWPRVSPSAGRQRTAH